MDKNKVNKKKRYFILGFWCLFIFPIVTVTTIFILIGTGNLGFMPTFEDLENPKNNLASEVYSEDGKLLGKFYYQNRSGIEYQDLSPHMVNALTSIEDIRFYNHSGIDPRGLGRVIFRTVLLGQRAQGGGSTITQQLAKNLFGRDTSHYNSKVARMWNMGVIKFKEWVTAVKLERNYTKEEIVAMYLNTVEFGHNSFGIKAAAKTFFDTSTDSLKIEEAAVFAGMVKAPTRYSPVRHEERSRLRRNRVLAKMNEAGYITSEEFDSLSLLPINLNFKVRNHNEGIATYFRGFLKKTLTASKPERKQYYLTTKFIEDSIEWATNPLFGWCNKNKKPDGSSYNIYKDGLKIYTTINSSMQEYAEKALERHLSGYLQGIFNKEQRWKKNPPFSDDLSDEVVEDILETAIMRTERARLMRIARKNKEEILEAFNKPVEMTIFSWKGDIDTVMSPLDSILYYKHFLRGGVMSMNPKNGHVKTYIGGINYKYFKYDAVNQQRRQVGSTIKPFLYTLAMQNGYSPCHKVPNVPTTFQVGDTIWRPRNSGSARAGEMVSLKWGLAKSNNYISAWLMKQFNPHAVIQLARKLGIKSYIDPVPAMVLGTSDIKLSEMVGAFSTFANKGVHSDPVYVTRIEDKNGNILAEFSQKKEEAISEETAFLMLNLLKGVIDIGTGRRLRFAHQLNYPIAGKTGTTQNHSDGWFIGITPDLVTGVWVGGEDRSIRFKYMNPGQGAHMALPIWGYFMEDVYKDSSLNISTEDFEEPLNKPSFNLDCDKVEEDKPQIIDEEDDLI